MASRRGQARSGILGRRRVAALAAPWETEPLGNARDKPLTVRMQAEIDSLKTVLADSERRVQALENERKQLIPVEEVHRELDQFNLPRRTPAGFNYFLTERFALLKARWEMERS